MRTQQAAGGLTPARVYAVAALWWLSAPFAAAVYYEQELKRGAFPPQADSILIGIIEYAVAWMLITPAVLLLVWWAGRGAPSSFALRAWDRRSRLRVVMGGGVALYLSVFGFQAILRGVQHSHWADAARGALEVVLALLMRALISAPRRTPPAVTSRLATTVVPPVYPVPR